MKAPRKPLPRKIDRRSFVKTAGQVVIASGLAGPITACGSGVTAGASGTPARVTPQGALYHSDWSTALGTSSAALLDTNKTPHWSANMLQGNPDVKDASSFFPGVGFANCYTCQVNGTAGSAQVWDQWDAAVGDTIYFRVYGYLDWPNSASSSTRNSCHYIQGGVPNNPSGTDYAWSFCFGHTNGSSAADVSFEDAPAGDRYLLSGLHYQTAYRYEVAATIVSSSTATFQVRIYDLSGRLLYTDADFTHAAGGGGAPTLTTAVFSTGGVEKFRQFVVGNNGSGGLSDSSCQNVWGGVCVRKDTWCGPYAQAI